MAELRKETNSLPYTRDNSCFTLEKVIDTSHLQVHIEDRRAGFKPWIRREHEASSKTCIFSRDSKYHWPSGESKTIKNSAGCGCFTTSGGCHGAGRAPEAEVLRNSASSQRSQRNFLSSKRNGNKENPKRAMTKLESWGTDQMPQATHSAYCWEEICNKQL